MGTLKMYTSKQLVKLLKEKENLPSDYAVAKRLGVTPQSISAIQNRGTTFSVGTCVTIAELIGLDPLVVIACVQVEYGEKHGDLDMVKSFSKYA